MNLYSLPNIAAFVFLSAVFLLVAIETRHRWNERILSFLAFCLFTAIWQLTYGLSYSMRSEDVAFRFLKIGYSAVIFMPVTFLHFVSSFLGKGRTGALRILIRISYVMSIGFLALHLKDHFVDGTYKYFFGYYPRAFLPVHLPFMLFMVVAVLTSMYILYREWSRVKKQGKHEIEGTDAHQIKLVLFAFFFITVSASDFLPNYGLEYYPIGVVCVVGFSAVITYSILRYNLHDIQIIVKRTLQFAGLVASVVGVVSLVAFVSQDLLAHFMAIPKWLANVFAAAIIAAIYGKLRDWLVNVTDKYLFQKKYDVRELLKKFTDEVMVQLDLDQLVKMTVESLTQLMKLENCSLLLVDKDSRKYRLVAAKGMDGAAVELDELEPFVTFLRETHEPIGLDGELGKVKFPEPVTNRLKELKARLCLPMEVHEELIGVLCLGKKKSDEEYTKEDLDVLSPVAKTLGIAVSNAQLVEELQKTQAEAAQREKLAVIGTLSAGINHEICNPLGIVKAQCEAFLIDQQDGILVGKTSQELMDRMATILQVALKQIDRATAITQKLSNFAKPIKEAAAQLVLVAQEVDEVLLLVGHDLQLEKIDVVKEMEPDLPPILADRRQLQEVLFNIIRNAGQAIKPPGTITVRAHTANGDVRIAVSDTGSGMAPETLQKIYNPFFTTKEPGKGTGLGLFIVRQIVERNKGRISVESTVGKGTTFFFDFPIAEPAAAAAA